MRPDLNRLRPAPEEQSKLLATASFFKPLWEYRAYSLSRDNKGNYDSVDRLREPENNKFFLGCSPEPVAT